MCELGLPVTVVWLLFMVDAATAHAGPVQIVSPLLFVLFFVLIFATVSIWMYPSFLLLYFSLRFFLICFVLVVLFFACCDLGRNSYLSRLGNNCLHVRNPEVLDVY